MENEFYIWQTAKKKKKYFFSASLLDATEVIVWYFLTNAIYVYQNERLSSK